VSGEPLRRIIDKEWVVQERPELGVTRVMHLCSGSDETEPDWMPSYTGNKPAMLGFWPVISDPDPNPEKDGNLICKACRVSVPNHVKVYIG